MDLNNILNNIRDALVQIADHYANPLILSGLIGAMIGYLSKTYFEHFREKKKQRYAEFAEELKVLHSLAAEVNTSFLSNEDSKIFKSSQLYLSRFKQSTLPQSTLEKFSELNTEIESIYSEFKSEGASRVSLHPMTKEQLIELGERWGKEHEKRKGMLERGQRASSEIGRLMKKEREKFI